MISNNKRKNIRANDLAFLNVINILATLVICFQYHYNFIFVSSIGLDAVITPGRSLWNYFSNIGYVFTELFFLISGILFHRVYFERISNGKYNFGSFIWKRVARLWPAFVVSEVIMYLIQCLLFVNNDILWSEQGSVNLVDFVTDLFFLSKTWINGDYPINAPAWYLGVLLICYVWGYFLTKLSGRIQSVLVFLIPIFIGLGMIYRPDNAILWNESLSRGYIGFFGGFFLDILLKYSDDFSKKKRGLTCFLALLIVSLGIMIESSPFPASFCSDVNFLYRTMFFPEIIFIFYCLKSANGLCDNPFVDFLGKYSYHIFLWNYPALAIYFAMLVNGIYPADPSSVSGIIFLAGLNLVLAMVTYIFIDKIVRKKTG